MKNKGSKTITALFELVYRDTPEKVQQVHRRQQAYHSFKARSLAERSWPELVADKINSVFGSISFAFLHVVWFTSWLTINSGYLPGVEPFDPYPFGLLTMIVSLEAIFLSIFVLISQNRESRVSDIRAEADFQINAQTEHEVTKLLHMVSQIHQHLGITHKPDKELENMKKELDESELEEQIKKEFNEL